MEKEIRDLAAEVDFISVRWGGDIGAVEDRLSRIVDETMERRKEEG